MKKVIVSALFGFMIGGFVAYQYTKDIYVSEANGFLFSQRASVSRDVIEVMMHFEKVASIQSVNGADCNIFYEYYSLIRSYKGEIERGSLILKGEDRVRAIQSIDRALKDLEGYRDRNGEQECNDVRLTL